MKRIQKTWNDFWGEFLLITFHADNPERLDRAKKRAVWIKETASTENAVKILDLGCGNGLMDICLAETGTYVVAVDRIKPVLERARKEAGNKTVEFIHNDLRDISFPECSFNCVLILETIGLMGMKDDRKLIDKAVKFLVPGGILLIDSLRPEVAVNSNWSRDFLDGKLNFTTSFDPESSIQTIIPEFEKENEIIELFDPYNSELKHMGVKRYLYPVWELKNIMEKCGLNVKETGHIWGENYYMLRGVKKH